MRAAKTRASLWRRGPGSAHLVEVGEGILDPEGLDALAHLAGCAVKAGRRRRG